jgi:hypothetical protein
MNRLGEPRYRLGQALRSLGLAELGKNIHPRLSLRMLCQGSLQQALGAGSRAVGQGLVRRFTQRVHCVLVTSPCSR